MHVLKVAFQGERGAYSEESAIAYFGRGITLVPCYSFADVFMKVKNKVEYDVNIVGEKILQIRHNLIAHKNTTLNDIKKIYAHPQAIAQCDLFLRKIGKEVIPFYDTAGSVKHIKQNKLFDSAAIASKVAAEIYDMEILEESIESNPNNYTRFFIISTSFKAKKADRNKTTIVFATKNIPGALFKSLKPFADRNINLTKLESRPSRKKPWEYVFYLDFEAFIAEPRIQEAISELRKLTTFLKILGSYPSEEVQSFY
ncbi:MAG: prephenate dehydratase [Candidatus Odinarchaeia archaeon]